MAPGTWLWFHVSAPKSRPTTGPKEGPQKGSPNRSPWVYGLQVVGSWKGIIRNYHYLVDLDVMLATKQMADKAQARLELQYSIGVL